MEIKVSNYRVLLLLYLIVFNYNVNNINRAGSILSLMAIEIAI